MKTLLKKIKSGIIEIARGMFTILRHAFRPAITLEYPEKKPQLNARARCQLALLVDNEGNDLCIGCGTCAKVCPCGDLIQVDTGKDENGKRIVNNFTIDLGRCIFCGNCTEVCPKGALIMTDKFELADYSREALVFDKKRFTLSIEESNKIRDQREKDLG